MSTIDRQLLALDRKGAALRREREGLLARSQAIELGLQGLEKLAREAPEPRAPALRIQRPIALRDQVRAAIGACGLDSFNADEIVAKIGDVPAHQVRAILAHFAQAGVLHRTARGHYRVSRGSLAS